MNIDFQIELKYTQKGSKSDIDEPVIGDPYAIRLGYFELPVLLCGNLGFLNINSTKLDWIALEIGASLDVLAHQKKTDNVALENGLKFHIDWLKGQKTGFFVDQRDNRSLLESYSKGRNVLNMFCYTGGFSVYSMRGGANLVHSVDSSAKAVELVNAT